MNIMILEDDSLFRQKLERLIYSLLMQYEDLEFEISLSTDDPYKMIDYANVNDKAGIYFLDIKIDGSDLTGLDTAKRIREKDIFSSIVIVTDYPDLQAATLQQKIEAMDYIIKSDENIRHRIYECIVLAYKQQHQDRRNCLIFESACGPVKIPYNDIYYIQTIKRTRKVLIVSKHSTFNVSYNLSELFSLIKSKDFAYCHRTIIANMNNIVSMDTKNHRLYFSDNNFCDYSKTHSAKIKKLMLMGGISNEHHYNFS